MTIRPKQKDAQHHWSSGSCNLETHWDIISHLSDLLLFKSQEVTSEGKDVEQKEPLGTVINWVGI